MKKKVLVTINSMEIGGIERSLAGMLGAFDYDKYDVDVLLFSKKGEFLPLIDKRGNLLPEIPQCATMLMSVKEIIKKGHFLIALARIYAKLSVEQKYKYSDETQDAIVCAHLQAYWERCVPLMPKLKKEYDAAISFMWPHHFTERNVRAKRKIAWVHTDYTKFAIDNKKDLEIWSRFDGIAAVSAECGRAFLKVYPSLSKRLVTVENIISKDIVRSQADEFMPEDMPAEDGYTRLLTVGRFCYAKAFDVAAEICKILVGRGLKIRWYAVGYGSEVQRVEKKIQELGIADSFIILGKKLNPYPYMKNCDIYVQPSRYEGKAVTVREAQILGKPVIITDFTTARGQVKDGFDAVISPMASESVADDIERMINDGGLREKLSRNAYNSDYSADRHMKKIYEMIEGQG